MKDKKFILNEIRRIALANNGSPPGVDKFRSESGIGEHQWRGVHWARWSDALRDAGFAPLEWNTGLTADEILELLAGLVRKVGKYPTVSEVLIEKRANRAIPGPKSLANKLGARSEAIRKLYEFCNSRDEYADVAAILTDETDLDVSDDADTGTSEKVGTAKPQVTGYVYLVKSGKLYKIGCSENHWRRKSELHKQTSEGITEVHTISAIDDAPGIERYWHERFKEKRQHGEWFDLSAEDVSAFKKRKFM